MCINEESKTEQQIKTQQIIPDFNWDLKAVSQLTSALLDCILGQMNQIHIFIPHFLCGPCYYYLPSMPMFSN
jgi:hypothetical protein